MVFTIYDQEYFSFLSFRIPEKHFEPFTRREVPWGFSCGGGNSLGEITFYRTYSRTIYEQWNRRPETVAKWERIGSKEYERIKDTSAITRTRKETWPEVVRRVVEGTYSIQRDWCLHNRLPWSDTKALRSAMEMFEYIFTFKFSPPGRGLWMMGTPFVHENGNAAALMNCGFVSTESEIIDSACWLMEASMLGVGVGFDVSGADKFEIKRNRGGFSSQRHVIPDNREGWVNSIRTLLRFYLSEETPQAIPDFDYSEIRPAGAPIHGFGGTAAGPEPLQALHDEIHWIFDGRKGDLVSRTDLADLMNLIGKCVVAGNVRRSAEICFGDGSDEFLDLKDWDANPIRNDAKLGWGWASNNSVIASVGNTDYEPVAERITKMGEPGLFWRDLARSHGRLVDPQNDRDYRVTGSNPCVEQSLESKELCCLVETFPTNCDSYSEFHRVLKFAYMYAKSVTLLPTPWPETNAIILRNRRIGTSASGLAQFVEERGLPELRRWADQGYQEVQRRDHQYSEWLCVRPSIKTTSIKPSGTVSLLAGVTPGVHWPVADTYIRRMRMGFDDPLVPFLQQAGYHVEPAVNDETTAVVSFPVRGPQVRVESEVTVWEKMNLAAEMQRWWADNQVSVTATFNPKTESDQLGNVIRAFEGQLKAVSFLPIADGIYDQMPYERVSPAEHDRMAAAVGPVDWDALYRTDRSEDGDRYCSSDRCEVF